MQIKDVVQDNIRKIESSQPNFQAMQDQLSILCSACDIHSSELISPALINHESEIFQNSANNITAQENTISRRKVQ